ncbi:cytidylate kinase-like family protein [Anaeromicropila populeti]|uniref:Cytidylate kinase n=1 Tax=Anaeromicropila populeti TaxID=37658 RepID=A0A1I6IFN9_9FIRM|nr:cytidylate kinase-like family protein [Anaeromicropila populeti]SFR65585.1 Cytidylate kinase [Anaeromicropila populeti]
MEHYIITVARGFGSGGKQIASQLAAELNIECYENRILTLASEYSGYEEKKFVAVDERLRGSSLRMIPKTLLPKPITNNFINDDQLFACQAEIIRNLADTESCVIVGKCADYVLKNYDNVISVYIEAPRHYCVARVMERMGVSEKEANAIITSTDKYRADYYKYYTHGNYWTNPVNYDITLNSEKAGEENCVKIIRQYLKLKFGI